ncbi:porin family protein [Sphingomonas sp. LB-2]|uniref:outer membrane protein n=1 Tax=Sphingomonas caeni TaxID=2984949 RepID=UPI0022300F01|nr:porin family protein [Sphingomonas caeni]MCW3845733.1 porin family protein [Sphingomonas caeni]
MRILALTALALATMATPAFAQEQGDFTGGHVELVGGLDQVSDGDEDESGAIYGVAAGFDFDLGGVIVGAEGEADLTSTKECIGTSCAEGGRDFYAGGRIGMPVGGRTLLYVKGGYTNARIKGTVAGTVVTSDDFDGVRVGVGAQTVVGEHFYAKIEYRYSNYEQGFDRHQGVVGVGYWF